MKKLRGYTLIEILIVLVILTIVATISVLATGDFGRERRIRTASEELQSLCTLLQTRAILTGGVFGIRFNSTSYQFFEFNGQKKKWSPILPNKLFLTRNLPQGMHLLVQEPEENQPDQPNVTILPGGELSPLKVVIQNDKQTVDTLLVENDRFILRASNE